MTQLGEPQGAEHVKLEMSKLQVSDKKQGQYHSQPTKEGVNRQRIQGHLYTKSFTKNLSTVEIVKDIIFNVIATELHHQFSEPLATPSPLTPHEARAQQLGLLTAADTHADDEHGTDHMVRRLHTFRHRTLKRLAAEVLAVKEDVHVLQEDQNRKATGHNKKSRTRFANRKNRLQKAAGSDQVYFSEATKQL